MSAADIQPLGRRALQVAQVVRPLLQWFATAARDLPWRRTLDPYAIWISEIMLQQTQVKTVIPYWTRWMQALPDARALARAPQDQVLKLWEGLGYYTRARNLQKAAQLIVTTHKGRFPSRYDDVLALPGIGRYTAGAVCSIAYNQPVPILDGNVIRVLTRLFGIGGDPREKKTNEQLWRLAELTVRFASTAKGLMFPTWSAGPCSALNQALMEFGALVCTPKQPRCAECPLRTSCRALATDRVEHLPNLPARAAATERSFVAFVLEHQRRWLIRQRPAGTVNAHLWEFPTVEIDQTNRALAPADLLSQALQLPSPALTPLPCIRHSITRYRITLTPFLGRWPDSTSAPVPSIQSPGPEDALWKTAGEIEDLALTSAHRRLWKSLLGLKAKFLIPSATVKAGPKAIRIMPPRRARTARPSGTSRHV